MSTKTVVPDGAHPFALCPGPITSNLDGTAPADPPSTRGDLETLLKRAGLPRRYARALLAEGYSGYAKAQAPANGVRVALDGADQYFEAIAMAFKT